MLHPTMLNLFAHPMAPRFVNEGQGKYDLIAKDWPDLHDLALDMTEFQLTSNVVEMAHSIALYKAVADIIRQHQPDIIITTFPTYQAPLLAYLNQQRSRIPLVTVITDLGAIYPLWFHSGVDLCLASTRRTAELARENGLQPSQVQVTGLPVDPMLAQKPSDKRDLRRQLGWEPDRFTLLVVGSHRVKALHEFAEILNHSGFNLQLVLVAGGDEKMHEHFLSMTWHTPAHIYNYVDNLPTFMHAADSIISKAGGLIVSESLAAGLPMFITQAIVEHEISNAAHVTTHGAGEMVETPLDLLKAICHWLMNEGRLFQHRALQAEKLGRPYAAYDVADIIASLAQQQRPPRNRVERLSLEALYQRFGIDPRR